MNKQDLAILSSDKIHTLKGVIYLPDGDAKGIFHIVHGMCEHIGRYDSFMSNLCEQGYIVAGYDNLGHGKTVNSKEEFGYIAKKDGYKFLVDDVNVFCRYLKSQFKGLPYYLFGHSMGSFIVRLAAEEYPENFDKLIVCGTGGPNAAAGIGLKLIEFIIKTKGEKTVSPLIENMAFGKYNKGFENLSRYDWLTKDREVIAEHEKDQLCQFRFTASAMHDLVLLNKLSNREEWFKNLPKDLPVLLVSGSDDPVGDHGKGVKTVYEKLLAAGHTDTALKIYENCRHEIHNDSCKEEMFKDILEFIA